MRATALDGVPGGGAVPLRAGRPRAGRLRTAVLATAALLVTACTGSPGAAAPTAPPSGAPAAPAAASATLPAVPDAFTAVTVRPVSASTFPFPMSDGQYHIAYDLQLTNASRVPATVDRVDVVDAADPRTVVASFSGDALVQPDCPYGDCNRLRLLPSAPATSAVIPPQESRALLVDFTVASPDRAPKAVFHRLVGAGAINPGTREPAPIDYLTAPFDIADGTPRVIAAPVKGDRWVAVNGCCLPGFPHRTSLATFNGELVNGQRFAIDWKQANENGEFVVGDPTRNESYVDYGAPIHSVADGTVVSTLDTLEPNTPGVLPADDPVLAPLLTVENVDGNHIVVDIGDGAYAFYAHLQKGTLLVKPGDRVTAGQEIAKLGNTGNSNASHLHFQLMNGPSVLGSDGLPYVVDGFGYAGQVAPELLIDADDHLGGRFLPDPLPAPEPHTDQLPASLAVVNFP